MRLGLRTALRRAGPWSVACCSSFLDRGHPCASIKAVHACKVQRQEALAQAQ